MSESNLRINNLDSGGRNGAGPDIATQIAKWIGGIVSLILIVGVVYWAYQLGQRDANDVPVIQAMGGVARERPIDPEGAQADHQGLDVNQVLASDQTAAVGAETQLAPPPQRATDEDQPISDQPALDQPEETVETLPVVVEDDTITELGNPGELVVVAGDPDMTRPVRRVETAGLSPSSDLLSNAIADAIAEANDPTAAVDTAVANVEQNDTPTAAPLVSNNGGVVSSVPIGTQMIQLGVFDDEESAVRNWDFLNDSQPDLLNGLDRYIERREAGGRVFYRLRAIGFADSGAASDLCAVLMGRDVQCIPVAAR